MNNSLVVKSNELIQARYNLNLNEQKIILYAASKLDREKNKFNILEIQSSEFMKLLNTTQFRYTEIKDLVSELMKKQVSIATKKSDLVVNWVSSIEYIKNSGVIEIEFSEKLIPYLLQLKREFTRYQLENILNLKSKYAIRIYELMKQYETIGKREFKLNEFKKILYCDGMYKDFRNFDRVVLKVTKDEINECTDLIIDYEKIKTGRSITSILFKIKSKNQDEEIFTNDIADLRNKMNLKSVNFNDRQILDIYEKAVERAGNEDIDIFEYIRLNYIHIKDKARNKYSYLLTALENDYASAIPQISLECHIANKKP